MNIESKDKELIRLQRELLTIPATGRGLEQNGAAHLQIFRTNIDAIVSIWQQAQLDAIEVRQWLLDSADLMKETRDAGEPGDKEVNDQPLA
jgi:hypothetical protein